jgi:sulfoxide reductase heme-binding subunit YedZ
MPVLQESKAMTPRQFTTLKTSLFILCLVPLVSLAIRAVMGDLGANPIEALIRNLGDWALRLLLVTLSITPLRRLTGWAWLPKLRRMFGLFAFFYVVMHMLGYVVLDQFFDWAAIGKDIVKRPFITVGFTAFLLLIPLAATSTNAMIRRLGGRRWQTLHRAVYAIGMLAVLHFWWMVKLDTREPALYAVILAVLLGARLVWAVRASVAPAASRLRRAD